MVAVGLISQSGATDFIKANNTTALNTDGSYTTAGAPGTSDTIVVNNTITALQNTPLGGALGVFGIRYASNASTGDRMRINSTGSHTLSLGAGGIDMSTTTGDVRLRIDSKIDFTANQNWTVASGARVNMNPSSVTGSGGNATVSGAGTVAFDIGGAGTLGSVITFNNSVVQINSSATTATFNNASNSFGRLNVYNGRGIFADIANKSANSSAGTGTTDTVLGGNGTNGIFEFSGSTTTTNRTFQADNRSTASGIDVTTSGVTLTVNGNITSTFGTSTSGNNGLVFGGAGNLTIGGIINDKTDVTGKTSVTKTGGGILTLSNINTYEGATIIDNGTLLVDGNISTSTLTTVNTGGTLGGSGTVGSTSVIGGTFAPGNSIDSIDITGNLTLGDSSLSNFEINTAGDVADLAIVSALLTFGGTLNVSNLGGTLVAGDVFNLFDWGTTSGAFGAVNLPALAGGLVWNQDGLYSTGTLAVVSVPEPGASLLGGLSLLTLLRRRRA